MEPYGLFGHAHYLDPVLPAVGLEQDHLQVAGSVGLAVKGHQADAPPTIASPGELPEGRQHAAGDGSPVVARLLAPRRFPAVSHPRSITRALIM